MEVTYTKFIPATLPADIIHACSELFSTNYGTWSEEGLNPGRQVSMSPSKMHEMLLFNNNCGVVAAQVDGLLIGHAFFVSFEYTNSGCPQQRNQQRNQMYWITQLVVHADHRGRGIATALLSTVASFRKSSLFAIGLVSSHPAAVRALEWATGSTCTLAFAQEYAADILVQIPVPYIKACADKLVLDESRCLLNTSFFVDHHIEANAALETRLAKGGWELGQTLPEGHEFFALCPIKLPSPPPLPSSPGQPLKTVAPSIV